jgi:hypothetical protein
MQNATERAVHTDLRGGAMAVIHGGRKEKEH